MKPFLGILGLLLAGSAPAREPDLATPEKRFRELPTEARRLTGPLFCLHGDERGWPSQRVGGKVPPGYGSKTLVAKAVDVEGPKAVHLRCEHREDPLGIDTPRPRLSWRIASDRRGEAQAAYRVLVASTPEGLSAGRGDLWDSGKVESDRSVCVEYSGEPLTSLMRCHWKVRVWTSEGDAWSEPAFWTVGLLKPSDWQAAWIRPNFKAEAPPSGGIRAASWIWYPEGNPAASAPPGTRWFRGRVELPAGRRVRKAAFTIAADNHYALYVNGRAAGKDGGDVEGWRMPRVHDVAALLKPGGNGLAVAATNATNRPSPAGLIGFLKVEFSDSDPLVALIDGTWKASNRKADGWEKPDFDDSGWINALVLGGYSMPPWGGGGGAMSEQDALRAGFLRRTFDLPEAPERAVASVNIAGYAELYVNGRKVGHDVLTPAVSDHNRQTFYVTYDVSPFLQKGRNVMALWLGRGWAEGAPAVRARLDASVAGRPFVLATDESWKGAASHREWIGGRKWNDFGGERVDARAEVADWNHAAFDDSGWLNAAEVAGPLGAAVAQPCPANRIGKRIPAARIEDLGRGKHEIDFGTALTGWLSLKMPMLPAGTVVKMAFGDVKRKGKYQTFKQVGEFVSAGRPEEVFEHKFNYAGFRYVVVEGLPSAPATDDAVAMLVESDLEPAGSFACSNDLLNRIHGLTQWTQRCLNLGGYYVDCPHRERMGYGDGQVAAEGLMTSFRADGFYRKWMCDWRLRQGTDGKLPHMAPFGKGGGGPGWPGLLASITWRHYIYYGDRRVVEENYDAICRYVDYLESLCKDGILRKYGGKWDFIGDWVPPRRGMDTNQWPGPNAAELFNNCYRVYQWDLLMRMAAVLDRNEEVARCRERLGEIRPAVHRAFYDEANRRYVIDEQAYYVMPLMTGVTPESEREGVLRSLERCILVKNNGHLDTGMLGTYFMMEYLRQIGRNDLVFTMFTQASYPGWGHMLAEGATTCWEQWNGHWSHIHSCFTSANNWLYQGLGGIRPDPAGPGFKKTLIRPAIVGDVTWVRCHHDSPYGRIVSNWKRDGIALRMDVEIPANTSATVYVPAKDVGAVTEGGRPAARAEGVRFLRMEKGAAVFAVGSGSYGFSSVIGNAMPE